jgi:hypothetical protein
MSKDGDTTVKPEFAEEQKPFLSAAQMQIPLYLQLISGRMPDYLRRYLAQTRGVTARQSQGNIQNLMRQAGMRGGADFGPQTLQNLANIYQQQPQILAGQLSQQRLGLTGQALEAMKAWSLINPAGSTTSTEQPGMGEQIGAGALQGFSQALGSRQQPQTQPTTGGRAAPPPPPTFRGPITPQTAMQNTNVPARMIGQQTGLEQFLPDYGITNIPGRGVGR